MQFTSIFATYGLRRSIFQVVKISVLCYYENTMHVVQIQFYPPISVSIDSIMFKFKKNVNILVQAGALKMPRHVKKRAL